MTKKKTPKLTPSFKKALVSLNPAQQEAVNSIEGPVMVIAGPGTGKTQIIATRIANILTQTDTDPAAILALTFTDSGSTAMRDRLISLIGPDGYKVNISTFHSFASGVIQSYPEYFIHSHTAQPLTDLERYQIINEIVDKEQLELLKPINAPHYYTSAIISSIQTLKREAINPDNFRSILEPQLIELEKNKDKLSKTEFDSQQKNLSKNLDLLKIFHKYQKVLKTKGRYDFEDMISWVINAFETSDELLGIFQERFLYFLADEYQDTNSAQNRILSLLTSFWGPQDNLFVVLDDEQSIYRFQGASLENALTFKDNFPGAKIITLTHNYRSQQSILDAARSVIDHNTTSLQNSFPEIKRQLKSQTKKPTQKINIYKTNHSLLENLYLTQEISKLISSGTSPKDIAVIARNNADLLTVSDFFNQYHLSHQILGGQNVLNTLIIRYFTKLLRVVYRSRKAIEDLDLFTLLHYPFVEISSMDILKLSRLSAKNKTTLLDTINSLPNDNSSIEHPQKFTDLINKLSSWNQIDSNHTFTETAQIILEQSSLLSWVLTQKNSPEHLEYLNAFFETIKQLNHNDPDLNLQSFLDYLDLMTENNIAISLPDINLTDNRITLTTAHKSKGLEWEHVFIINCIDGKWGNQSNRDLIKLPSAILQNNEEAAHDLIEDERRLFYVALTRAKNSINISYPHSYLSYGRTQTATPSQFISELPKTFANQKTTQPSQGEINQLLQTLITPTDADTSPQESVFLNSILENFRLSVTALNTYLECPHKFKLNTLLRVPKAKESYLSFGTAVHAALERFHNQFKSDSQLPSKDFLISNFTAALKKETMTQPDYQARHQQGKKILSAYYDLHKDDFKPPIFTEKFFGYGFSTVTLDDIPLAGKIDRIDFIDPDAKTVRVVDYKTGKRKTRGQIEGTTQDSDGAYKRQLVFYQLLTDLDPHFSNRVIQTELDFVEAPHNERKSGKEVFTITPTEVEELKEVIRATMKEIRAHKFHRTQDYSICHRCEFKDHCWPQGTPQYSSEQLSFLKTTVDNSTDK